MFHANLIMPYKETELYGPNFTRPPPDLVDGEEEYEVEKVIDAKQIGKKKKWHYLIKWKGYPTSDNSWEPEDNIQGSKELIEGVLEKESRTKKTKQEKNIKEDESRQVISLLFSTTTPPA